MTDMEEAQAEAVQEVASAILKAAGAAMERHGNDPLGNVIVAAGFARALQAIGRELDSKIPATVREMLELPTR